MAIELGFTSVMMDGSLLADGKTPSDYEYNVAVTREVVEAAHAKGVSVEGELGTLGGIEDGHGSGEVHLTDPDQAVDFVEQTGVDALAVAIGTSHGAYKFTTKPTGDVLAMHLIEEIHTKLPDTHMVMHGSSSVPQELVDRINAAGGKLEATYGVPVEEIQQGIRHGVRKVNVDTDGRLAITAALREALQRAPVGVRPARVLQARARGDEGGRRRSGCATSAPPATPATTPCSSLDEMAKRLRGEPGRCLSSRTSTSSRSTRSARSRSTPFRLRNRAIPARRSALAPAAYVLYTRIMKHNPADPHWPDRDRFVLSAGHASMLLYASLHLSGYDAHARRHQAVPPARLAHAGPPRELHDARASRRPPARSARGSRTASGWRWRRSSCARSSAPTPATTTSSAICSDGDLMEGVASEAASIAGPPAARPARLPLRRQRDHDRRPDRASPSRPRTCRSASRRTAGRRCSVEDGNDLRGDRGGDPRRDRRGGAPDADQPAHGDRLRLAARRHPQRALRPDARRRRCGRRRRRSAGIPTRSSIVPTAGVRALARPGARARRGTSRPSGRRASTPGRPRTPSSPPSGTTPGPAGRRRASPRRCPSSTPDAAAVSTRKAAGDVMQAFAPVRPDDDRRRRRPRALDLHAVRGRARTSRPSTPAATSPGASASTAWAPR